MAVVKEESTGMGLLVAGRGRAGPVYKPSGIRSSPSLRHQGSAH